MYHTLALACQSSIGRPLSVEPVGRLGLVTFDREHGTLVKRAESQTIVCRRPRAHRRVGRLAADALAPAAAHRF
jgi:hypothetical protein